MKKLYIALALTSLLAACTTDSASQSPSEASDNGHHYAKVDVVTGTLEDARDGKVYKTVQIKDQVWMAENLNFAIDSSFCPHGVDEKCDEYGRLYKWAAVMDSSETVPCGYKVVCDLADTATLPKVRGICPEGWHVPTDAEWQTLIEATGDVDYAAKALKSSKVWGAEPGDDIFQFNVLPTGYRNTDGDFVLYDAGFWTSSEKVSGSNSYYAWGRFIDQDYSVKRRDFDKKSARSVRCIKD